MILVTGAKGVVGAPLCERLSREGIDYLAVSRQTASSNNQLQWDLSKPPSEAIRIQLGQVSTIIHCAPIWLIPEHLELLKKYNIQRLIVFSSSSVISKRNSQNRSEQELVEQLMGAEQALMTHCETNHIQLTIFRPSLIYGYGRDQNVSHIAKFIRRFGVMFLVGKASGLRQPVHADDLVEAALACISKNSKSQDVYAVAGKDTMTYREMVRQIFIGLGRRPIIINIPLWVFRPALVIAAKIGGFSYTAEMADRMNQDLNYDYSQASNDIGFSPQGFLEKPKRDLIS